MSGIKICIVSGSRAEFGQLLPLLTRIKDDPFFDLDFVITGAHLLPESGSIDEITGSPIQIAGRIPVRGAFSDTPVDNAMQIGGLVQDFVEYFSIKRPDILVAIGDRFEMFGVAVAASALLIPIAHICGGSTTSGAIDEVYRHSMTKMSSLHFVTCEAYKKRVIQLGENPRTVHNVGSLAIENCLNVNLISEEELRDQVGLPAGVPYCVITYHPVTFHPEGMDKAMRDLICALDELSHYHYLVTLANADPGGARINEIWKTAVATRPNLHVVPSLGMRRYLTALTYAKMMVGNSSSGTTEGPALHIPTVDIGDRQKGRYFAKSVVHCEPDARSIVDAMSIAGSGRFRMLVDTVNNPFGDGTTSSRILEVIKREFTRGISVAKDFYDIEFGWLQ